MRIVTQSTKIFSQFISKFFHVGMLILGKIQCVAKCSFWQKTDTLSKKNLPHLQQVEKSRTVQKVNTQNLQLMQPGLWRPDDTWPEQGRPDCSYTFALGCNRS